mgnify:CR=1 FL=1
MNGGNVVSAAAERKWQWTGGLVYVAVFFYIFLLKPVPEQSLLREVTVDARPAVRRMVPLSLTFAPRVVTGGEAGRFLNAVIADLQRAG